MRQKTDTTEQADPPPVVTPAPQPQEDLAARIVKKLAQHWFSLPPDAIHPDNQQMAEDIVRACLAGSTPPWTLPCNETVASRICERGTLGCTIKHAAGVPDPPSPRADT